MLIFRSSQGSGLMCSSSKNSSDNCTFNTNNDTFYVRVLAFETLQSVTLEITAERTFSVSEVNEPETTTEITTASPSLTEIIRKLIYFTHKKLPCFTTHSTF